MRLPCARPDDCRGSGKGPERAPAPPACLSLLLSWGSVVLYTAKACVWASEDLRVDQGL